MPRRPGARRFDESGIVGVGHFVFVEMEGIQINQIGGPVVSLGSRLGVQCIAPKAVGAAHPELAGGNQHHVLWRRRLPRDGQREAKATQDREQDRPAHVNNSSIPVRGINAGPPSGAVC